MADVGIDSARIVDSDGDSVDNGDGKLKVLTTKDSTVTTLDTFTMIDVDNASELLSATVGTFTDCLEMVFQADENNTGYIMLGDTDVADNRGIKLNPGDTLILSINDTRSVNLWGSAANQNLRLCLVRV
tara:strand:+ start:204 stop:590 length:387 start_codon:yes stop_codon:yes gene_type:complete